MNRVHDYQALEDQYVHGSMSLRELCRLNDIKHHSPVVTHARADHWDEKRAAFQGKVDARVDDKVAAQQAARRAEVAGRRAEPRTVGSSPIPLLEGPVKAN
jgi:hypothetical protein